MGTDRPNHAQLEFWFDFGSTYSYLSAMRIDDLAKKAGVEVTWMPFLLGPIFAKWGWQTSPFNLFPSKGRYMWRDVERLAAAYGLPLRRPATFPQFALIATRVAMAAAKESWLSAFCRAVFFREFAEGGEITSDSDVAGILQAVGIRPDAWLAAAREARSRSRCASGSRRGSNAASSARLPSLQQMANSFGEMIGWSKRWRTRPGHEDGPDCSAITNSKRCKS